eukprot:scaffold206851_cov37-Tisochrysis_lutea.AAC.1
MGSSGELKPSGELLDPRTRTLELATKLRVAHGTCRGGVEEPNQREAHLSAVRKAERLGHNPTTPLTTTNLNATRTLRTR